MTITKCRINDLPAETEPWLIEDVVCPWLTLLSGQPKHGKSLLAGHIANSVINGVPMLGKNIRSGIHSVGWMGYDGGWKQEIQSRWSAQVKNQIVLYDPIRSQASEAWTELGNSLREDGASLFILDHLYGMAGTLGLNDANQFAILANLLRPIYEEFKIPVLVLAQAGKGEFSRGRAAHSVALEGEARCLLKLFEKRKNGSRRLEITSNTHGEEEIKITLTPSEVTRREEKSTTQKEVVERLSPDQTRHLLSRGNPNEMISWSGAGRELHRLGLSINPEAGRSLANRLRRQGLLKKESGRIVAGDSLLI